MARRITKPTSAIFRGVEYRIAWRKPKAINGCDVAGTCDPPTKKNCQIEVCPSLKGRNKLRVLIDEAIHACLWDIDNESVAETSTSIAEFLNECGFKFNNE